METLKKLAYLLSKKDQKRAIILLFLTLLVAFVEIVGLISIVPFMAVLSNPEIIEINFFLKKWI